MDSVCHIYRAARDVVISIEIRRGVIHINVMVNETYSDLLSNTSVLREKCIFSGGILTCHWQRCHWTVECSGEISSCERRVCLACVRTFWILCQRCNGQNEY